MEVERGSKIEKIPPTINEVVRVFANIGRFSGSRWAYDYLHTVISVIEPSSQKIMNSIIYTIIKQKLELKKKSESWAIDTSAGVIFFDNSPLNK